MCRLMKQTGLLIAQEPRNNAKKKCGGGSLVPSIVPEIPSVALDIIFVLAGLLPGGIVIRMEMVVILAIRPDILPVGPDVIPVLADLLPGGIVILH